MKVRIILDEIYFKLIKQNSMILLTFLLYNSTLVLATRKYRRLWLQCYIFRNKHCNWSCLYFIVSNTDDKICKFSLSFPFKVDSNPFGHIRLSLLSWGAAYSCQFCPEQRWKQLLQCNVYRHSTVTLVIVLCHCPKGDNYNLPLVRQW